MRRQKSDDLPATPITRDTLRDAARLLGYLRPYRVKFALAMFCLFVSGLTGLGFPYLAGNLVDAVMVGVREGVPSGWLENVNLVALGLVSPAGARVAPARTSTKSPAASVVAPTDSTSRRAGQPASRSAVVGRARATASIASPARRRAMSSK